MLRQARLESNRLRHAVARTIAGLMLQIRSGLLLLPCGRRHAFDGSEILAMISAGAAADLSVAAIK
jgi:hypothetical protein